MVVAPVAMASSSETPMQPVIWPTAAEAPASQRM